MLNLADWPGVGEDAQVPVKLWLPIVAFSIILEAMICTVLYLQNKHSIEQITELESLPSERSSDNIDPPSPFAAYPPPPYDAEDHDISPPKALGTKNVMVSTSDDVH